MWSVWDLCIAYGYGVDLQKECKRCMILREPVLQRFPGAHWVWYCLVKEMPAVFRVSERLHETHSEILQYCATLWGKTLTVSNESVDLDSDDGIFCKPAGFLICPTGSFPTSENKWMFLFHIGKDEMSVYQRRFRRT